MPPTMRRSRGPGRGIRRGRRCRERACARSRIPASSGAYPSLCRPAAGGLPTFWVAAACAYHQHHPVHVPPLQHFEAILANAARFHRRHGRWCMTYWLDQFRAAGLIAWDADAPAIRLVRRPRADEVAAALRPDALFS
jgi:hypothetical protein